MTRPANKVTISLPAPTRPVGYETTRASLVQRSVMFTSFWIRIKHIQNDITIFSLLILFTLALENLYFNTLDQEKVQRKSLGCIKTWGDTSPTYCTPTLQGATAEGWKSRGLPTPGLGLGFIE